MAGALIARSRRGRIRVALDEAEAQDSVAEIEVETGLLYPDGDPVTIVVRRRAHRYDLDDGGGAIARAGRPAGWFEAADLAVRRSRMNVSPRSGRVFVGAVEGRNLEDLAGRLAQASLDVLAAIVELE